ncbi:hypothetical protein [Halorarius halobius]|uniref:hypothetical protein n=1 Tax=Halorarius halobius TaxID=2962671 RepID=UPI0020CDBB69|nr:hypothetical protein [Halorarius halobius]
MSDPATDPDARRTAIVRAVMAHRREAGDPVAFHACDERVRYDDRLLELGVSDAQRERLDALLDDYPVFKLKQPETRTAPDGTVFVAAIADPKHLADFLEDCFRQVYGHGEGYALTVA